MIIRVFAGKDLGGRCAVLRFTVLFLTLDVDHALLSCSSTVIWLSQRASPFST